MTAELDTLLARAEPGAPRPQRHLWLIELLAWVRKPVAWGRRLDPALALHRWQQLLQQLDADPAARAQVVALLRATGAELDAVGERCAARFPLGQEDVDALLLGLREQVEELHTAEVAARGELRRLVPAAV